MTTSALRALPAATALRAASRAAVPARSEIQRQFRDLLRSAHPGLEVLRLHCPPAPCVVVGYGNQVDREVDAAQAVRVCCAARASAR